MVPNSRVSAIERFHFTLLLLGQSLLHHHMQYIAGIPFVRQSQNAITIAVASSLVMFILSSTLFFILGCACGWVGHKHKTKWSDKNARSEAALLYENLQPSTSTSILGEQERATFELEENVAYGPIKSTYN